MTRLKTTFAKLRQENKPAFISFLTAGDPDIATTLAGLHALVKGGADILEIGMPFSDPMADGEVIQRSVMRALQSKTSLKKVLKLVADFRSTNAKTPVVLMGYYNPIYCYGVETFVEEAVQVGVDGLLIVDIPSEVDNELCKPARAAGLDWVRLITPTTSMERVATLLENASGFLYYVTIKGITGGEVSILSQVKERVQELQSVSDLPVVTGFGIKTKADVAKFSGFADGVVVGSALIETIERALENTYTPEDISNRLFDQVKELVGGLNNE